MIAAATDSRPAMPLATLRGSMAGQRERRIDEERQVVQ
jgi:hypothetical protein